MARTPTPEQRYALEQFLTGDDLVIEAAAGAGKTATLELLAAAGGIDNGLYLAFNRAIADEAQQKFRGSGVSARTGHSLAYAAFGAARKHRLSVPHRPLRETAAAVGAQAYAFSPRDRATVPRLSASDVYRVAQNTVAAFCNGDAAEIGPAHVVLPKGLLVGDTAGEARLRDAVVTVAKTIWADIVDLNGTGRVTHDAYLKLYELSRPRIDVDVLFLDEAQDSNPVMLSILRQQTHAQKVIVGDSAQAIYGFRGTSDSMSAFPDARRARLTTSFRFGQPIADEANKWLTLLGIDMRVRGLDTIASTVGVVPTADAVLVRSNGAAIGELMDAQQRGRAVSLGSSNRAKELRALAQAADDLQTRHWTSHPEFMLFKSWGEVQDHVDNDDGSTLAPLVKVVDAHGAREVVRAVDAAVPMDRADVTIATAHTAKGLEWSRVRIGDDFPQPRQDRDGLTTLPNAEEQRLAYVALTRAQHQLDIGSLDWIDEHAPTQPRPMEQVTTTA